jgi:hypothetical protein
LQEYYIRHLDDSPVTSGDERDRLGRCLEAAIQRRNTEVSTSNKTKWLS